MAKTILITGASSGIGLATAKLFASAGWQVVATIRDPASACQDIGVLPVDVDVRDEASIAKAVETTTERFGAIDAAVNNAGYGVFGPLEGVSSDQLLDLLHTNVVGAATVIRHVAPVMRRQGHGVIVNVSSIGGRIAVPFQSAYNATKFALEGLSESLRYELRPHGIRVKLVEPAHFRTDFAKHVRWAQHSAYEAQVNEVITGLRRKDQSAPSCEPVAHAIFRAVTDDSDRLRYPVQGWWFRMAHSMLPDAVWRSILLRQFR